MKYRREIDGLRALAVLPVILFHADFNLFGGGYIGVDIFFVISGYLITTIILAELEQGNFSIISFYERRARRILPALFFVMAISIPFAWILLPPFDLNSFSKSLISVPLFVSNFFFWKDGGYFETASELKPLLHTWSLAVEEQYYLFFPIFLIFLWKLGRRWALLQIYLIAIVSLLIAQLGSIYKPIPNFLLLPTRAWELAIGALVAFYISNKKLMILSSSIKQILSLFGIILIAISIFVFNKQTPFPSFYAIVPTVGTALILLFASQENITGKILSGKIIVYMGLISYSSYLWHQPILAFSRYYFSSISNTLMFALVIFILLISFLSWHLIERPFRNKDIFSRKSIFLLSIFLSLFFISFGYASYKVFGSSSNFGSEAQTAKALVNANAVYFSNMDERKFIKFRIQFETINPNIIVLGSSRIMAIGEHNYSDKLLNFGVSGSSIEDDIAIADMATKKFKPRTLLIAADPWLFNSKSGQTRWKSLNDEYLTALVNINISNTPYRSNEVITQTPLTSYMFKIYSTINHQQLVAADDLPESRNKIKRDGSRIYSTSYASANKTNIVADFDILLNYAMKDYVYSKESEETFSKFIDTYSKKYNIVLILSPYHPDLYDRMRRERPIFLKIENNFRDFSKTHNVRIIGSYNPNNIGCDASDFLDGMHPRDICMGKVIKQLGVI